MARSRGNFQTDETDVIADRIYTKLEGKSTPCYVSELCSPENEELFEDVLKLMCISGMVTRVGKQYMLTENTYSSKVKQQQRPNPPAKASVREAFPPPSPTRKFVRVQQRSSQTKDVKTTAQRNRDKTKMEIGEESSKNPSFEPKDEPLPDKAAAGATYYVYNVYKNCNIQIGDHNTMNHYLSEDKKL